MKALERAKEAALVTAVVTLAFAALLGTIWVLGWFCERRMWAGAVAVGAVALFAFVYLVMDD